MKGLDWLETLHAKGCALLKCFKPRKVSLDPSSRFLCSASLHSLSFALFSPMPSLSFTLSPLCKAHADLEITYPHSVKLAATDATLYEACCNKRHPLRILLQQTPPPPLAIDDTPPLFKAPIRVKIWANGMQVY
ncbi:uncharacterized protein LOC110006539 [Amborella trichopoda]|uniref:uncharacterized protein LOC110006539 n=1 Tax=Amborella trichopoda TaxID=13333 RepID=UPI0009BF6117|nr:uncharacterized protein LOC110006539 [Amborella trichopoda]|eukprot:XP_020517943.1 uncharacterized protein LOC110006539 [Amborella trichopoda]